MLLHGRNAAEEIAEQREQRRPAQAAEHRERRETAPTHAGNTGNERHERADEREETAKEHGQRAPLLNHLLGFLDALRGHGLDFAGFKDATAEEMADPVVALVADDRGAPDHRQQSEQRQCGHAGLCVGGGEEAGREQQRIARQEREEHHAGLNEDDKENEAEGRRDAHGNPAGDRGTGVLDEVDEEIDDIHRSLCVVLRGCAGSVRVACFSIVRNECAVANQSQTTNGSMQCASQCDDGWQICTNRQYVPMGAYVRVLVGGVRPVVPGGCSMVVRQLSSVLSGCPVRPARPASAWGTPANPGLNSLYYGDRQMVHESRPI